MCASFATFANGASNNRPWVHWSDIQHDHKLWSRVEHMSDESCLLNLTAPERIKFIWLKLNSLLTDLFIVDDKFWKLCSWIQGYASA